MKIMFLGTGTSQGVPVIGCTCEVCRSADPKDTRLRTSVLIEYQGKVIVIDTGPDFRYQMLRAGADRINGVLLTHEHKDHIAGLDDIRAFNFLQKQAVSIYGNKGACAAVRREFYYAFQEPKYPGAPMIDLHEIDHKTFTIAGIPIIPIKANHGQMPVLGFRIGDFTYITDMKTIEKEEREKIYGSAVLVINALQKEKHDAHLNLEDAVIFAKDIGANQTLFTHIGHRMGKYAEVMKELPPGMELAYDRLIIRL